MTPEILLLVPAVCLAPWIVRRVRWVLQPNNATVLLELGSRERLHIRLRVTSAKTAARWVSAPPKINPAGLDGLG